MAGSFDELISALGTDGRDFERLAKWFLESDPEWVAQFREVWHWNDWPGRWGPDKGIDLIAQTHDDRTVAIQAKNYAQAHSITKRDVDTFLSESNRAVIADRLLIATTDRVAASAREVMASQEKPVSTCLLSGLKASPVVWPASMSVLLPATPERSSPRPHQKRALAAIEAWAATDVPRGQILMACGTGKSLAGVWAADRLDARRVLVMAPTLELLRQLSRDWAQHAAIKRRLFHISSDADRQEDDVTRGDELGSVRSTDPAVVAERLRTADDLVVLCTYNSSRVLAKAMAEVQDVEFDLAVIDEAHRCAGAATSTYKIVLRADAIRARRRLFFTATPTVFSAHEKSRARLHNVRVASMDDHDLFGPVVHRLSFSEAIEQGLLCRYQVAVIPIADDEVLRLIDERRFVTADGDRSLLAGSLATQIACARAMRRYGCRRVVAFQPTIPQSRRFADHFPVAASLLPDDEQPAGALWSRHVDGSAMQFSKRARLIDEFKRSTPADDYRLLSNVRLLAEGVDVPGIDAIAFVDTRRGHAQIVQAVGRAVRTAPGKEVGTIVLPIVLRQGESVDAALARTEHRMVVDVLGALRSHDSEVVKSLDTLRFGLGPDADPGTSSGRFVVDAPVEVGEEFAEAVQLALANALSVTVPRPKRSRAKPTDVVLLPRRERSEPTAEEKFWIGLDELRKMSLWALSPQIPDRTGNGFPIGIWWEEAKRRWAARELDTETKRVIANSVSWLAGDITDTAQAKEMMSITDYSVPEQVAVQLGPGGVLEDDPRAAVLENGGDTAGIVEELTIVHDAVTHAAMSPGMRVRYLLVALGALAPALHEADKAPDPPSWLWTTQRKVALAGFVFAVQIARLGPLDKPPKRPLHEEDCHKAHMIGLDAAVGLFGLIRRMKAYQFSTDRRAVAERRLFEHDLEADQRLDAIGWDIFMLVLASGGSLAVAVSLATEGTLRQRRAVRADRLRSALARIDREDD